MKEIIEKLADTIEDSFDAWMNHQYLIEILETFFEENKYKIEKIDEKNRVHN